MGLREDILNRPDLAEAVAARDCETLAAAMSVGRVQTVSHEVGERGILDVLGPVAGDNFLAVLENIKTADDLPGPLKPCFGAIRRGVSWLKTSGLDVGAQTTRLLLDGLAGAGVLPQADVNKVKALAERPAPVGAREVAEALYNDDGSAK
jgi:hypothetical protein